MLERIPSDTFIVPGSVPGFVFGLVSLLVAWGMWRRQEIGWLARVKRRTDRH